MMVRVFQGALLATALAAAGLQSVHSDSTARCSISASASGAVIEEGDTLFEAVGDFAIVVCDGVEDEPIVLEEKFSQIARAVAEAVVNVTASCYASGRASFTLNGYSYAEFEARSLLKTVAQLFLSTEVCNVCEASVQLVAENIQEAIATAVAEAEVNLEALSAAGDPDVTAADTQFDENVVTKSVEGVASFLVDAQADVLNNCGISATVGAGDRDGTTFAECTIDVQANTELLFEESQIETLTASLTASFCDAGVGENVIIDSVTLSTQTILTAAVLAVSDILGQCLATDENSAACARGIAEARSVATSILQVAIDIIIDVADSGCVPAACAGFPFPITGLQLNGIVLELFVDTLTTALADNCIEGAGVADIDALAFEIGDVAFQPIFEVLLNTTRTVSECTLEVSYEVDFEPEPVPPNPPVPPIVDPPTTIPPVLLPVPPPFPPPTITNPPVAPPVENPDVCANACAPEYSRCSGRGVTGVSPCCQPDDGSATFECKATGTGASTAFCRPSDDRFFRDNAVLACTPAP